MLELLMPAGNLKKLKTAFHFGADAVYLGGKDFSLRANAQNFTREEIVEGIDFAHSLHKKVYVTANIFAKNDDFEAAKDFFIFLESALADAVLISDIGLVSMCQEVAPNLKIHLSTQANTTNKYAVKFWAEQGIERVVLARELSLFEINEVHNFVPSMQLEAFVHGAMCVGFSGRCLLSSYFSNRSANSGQCIQPCRWEFEITETKNHCAKPIEIQEDKRGTYFLNSRDLRLLSHIPELAKSGVCSLKVEGRMKSEFYVASVALAYRRAIDEFEKYGEILHVNKFNFDLEQVAHRSYTDAYFDGDNSNTIAFDSGQVAEAYEFIAVVEEYHTGYATVEMRNRFREGDELELLSPSENDRTTFIVTEIFKEDGSIVDDAKLVQHHYSIAIPFKTLTGDILRKKNK